MATLTVTIAVTATTINAIDPGLVSQLLDDAANYVSMGGTPVAASGSFTTTINEISNAISYTVAKS